MAQIRKRQLKKGVSYEVRIHRVGQPTLSKSFRQIAEARAWANETESRIDRGQKFNKEANRSLLSDVLDEFNGDFTDPKSGKKIEQREEERLGFLKRDLGEFAVDSLDHELVRKYLAKLLVTEVPPHPNRKQIHKLYNGGQSKNYAASTVRKVYYQLKKVVQWHARRHGYQLDVHLFENQAIPASWDGARSRRLEEEEEVRLYVGARAGYAHKEETVRIIGFALETAMRAQEIILARWSDLNLDVRTLNIPKEHTKTDTARQIPLSNRAVQILNQQLELRNAAHTRIFDCWKDSDMLSKHFRRLCHRTNITDLKFHDLRHEATSRFFENGKLNDMEIMKITGHTQYSTLQRYANLRPSQLVSKMD